MWPDELFAYVLEDLAREFGPAPAPDPLPVDRWLARSALQKAIRRAEVALALRAAAALHAQVGAAIWRALVVIALEDVGVAGIDVVARVVAAARDKAWRAKHGGDWAVVAWLVRQLAVSPHDQAACDLLMRVLNDPALEPARVDALEAGSTVLADRVADETYPLLHRAAAALALGGGLADEQPHRQPAAVFHSLALEGRSSHVVASCHAAWRTSRNEMALLLPLLWQPWLAACSTVTTDDLGAADVKLISGVPACAIDQFTRAGGQVARALLRKDDKLRGIMDCQGVPGPRQPRVVGDLLFLLEGGLVRRRARWACADHLRLPERPLPGTFALRTQLQAALDHMAAQADQIADLRRQHLIPAAQQAGS